MHHIHVQKNVYSHAHMHAQAMHACLIYESFHTLEWFRSDGKRSSQTDIHIFTSCSARQTYACAWDQVRSVRLYLPPVSFPCAPQLGPTFSSDACCRFSPINQSFRYVVKLRKPAKEISVENTPVCHVSRNSDRDGKTTHASC